MLPPNPHSRQPSYANTLPRRTSYARIPSRVYHPDEDFDDEEAEEEMQIEMEEAGERGLEETLEKLGFGAYQWRLLALCGFGWMSDNSALQCIAVILPRVQVHFDLSSKVVGLLSASTMAGMMVGAVGWGVISDLMGRALPFNATLFLTAVFGIGASYAPDFRILCIWMFLLGSAVGGSMPTDGTLFLENLPHSKQYLLTLLSVFFSLGAVLSSVVSFIFLPGASCSKFEGCDVEGKANDGWRWVLFVLGLINLACSFARLGLFRLHESPRFLVSTGREAEAVVVLNAIATFNAREMDIEDQDVQEVACDPEQEDMGERSPLPNASATNQDMEASYNSIGLGAHPSIRKEPIRMGSAFYHPTPMESSAVEHATNTFDESFATAPQLSHEKEEQVEGQTSWWYTWRNQLGKLFVPQWRRTVVLMWFIWGSMSFAYTMFNVWLPAVLESRASGEGDEAIREALREFVLYSRSILGAWLIQTSLGRRKSLAICTLATALSTFAFIRVEQNWAVVVSSMIISMMATAMYAVLYGMTPEIFGTGIRGTACGTSAALSRLTGILAPVSAGLLLSISPSLPVFASAAILVGTAGCSLLLPFERVAGKSGSGGMTH
ncbi:hypothetical protein P7C73_g4374, partial [Tremellales sp. Uapishka_1]